MSRAVFAHFPDTAPAFRTLADKFLRPAAPIPYFNLSPYKSALPSVRISIDTNDSFRCVKESELRAATKHFMRMIINSDIQRDKGMTEKTDATDPRTDDQVVMIDSGTLLQGAREVRIRHGESVYRLILTKLGKLILTK